MTTTSWSAVQPHLNGNLATIRQSATIAINDRCNALRAQGKEIFRLGLGQSPFPVPEPVVEALRQHAHEKDYLPAQGLPELREAVAKHHVRNLGIACHPDDVMIGPGSKELMFLLQLAYDGQLVVPTPSWVSYVPQARIIGSDIATLPSTFEGRWMPDPADFDALSRRRRRPRLLLLNYPSNPTGMDLDDDVLAAMVDVARDTGSLLLSDEIYAKLNYRNAHRSAVPLYPDGTIYSGGLSKWCGAGGWRLGAFVFPPELHWLRDAMVAVATETFTSTSAPIQWAAVRAFDEGPEIETYLDRSRRILGALAAALCDRLDRAGVRVHRPDGAFYLFPDFSPFADRLAARGVHSGQALCERLLDETGVAMLPGVDFGRPAIELTARLAFVDFDGGAALDAVGDGPLDEAFLRTHCGRVLDAVDRTCEWVQR